MKPWGDDCERCVNRNMENGCMYRESYNRGFDEVSRFLANNKEAEWYGSIKMSCDYYVHDKGTDELATCCGG